MNRFLRNLFDLATIGLGAIGLFLGIIALIVLIWG